MVCTKCVRRLLLTPSSHQFSVCFGAQTHHSASNVSLFLEHRTKHYSKRYQSGISNLARDPVGIDSSTELSNKELLTTMFGYVWPKNRPDLKRRVLGALALLAMAKCVNAGVPFSFKFTIDHLTACTSAATVIDSPAFWTSLLICSYGMARFGSSSFDELRRVIFARVAQNSVRRIAKQVFRHLHSLDLSFHLFRRTGALDRAIGLGSRGINTAISLLVFNLLPVFLELALVSGILWYKCGTSFALTAISFAALYTFFTVAVTQWRTEIRRNMNRADQDAGNLAHDSLINFETVKYFGNEHHEAEMYDKILAKYETAALKTQTTLSFLNWGQQCLFTAALTYLMLKTGTNILAGDLTVGDLVLVNGLLFQLSVPLNFLGSTFREVKQAMVDMQTMFQLLRIEPSIQSKVGAADLNVSASNANVNFENVSFGYLPDHDILSNFSFSVPAGSKIAIVGGSGSGKSTIVRLLYRFYDPREGSISINGQDIKDVSLESLRNIIGVVPQDCILFHDTIMYNIRYGCLSATDEQVYEAARMANLHDSIMNMPNSYDTQVGERGLMLSGGEKQRLAIARAFLKNPLIFIYDEATSSLDSITEQNILRSLNQAVHGKSTIVIAHRLSTIVDSDVILVINKGKIVERGSHWDLVNTPDSFYSKLWNTQHSIGSKKLE